jgi:3-phenylpropionate/trans-cinnamate dioxygenase ferredoxin reductase subunit
VPGDLKDGRIVIVGASPAGLRAAEALREEGFTGSLTVVGDEPHAPYDRPPLSKQVLLGQATVPQVGTVTRTTGREVTGSVVLAIRPKGRTPFRRRAIP